jgi:DNA invertase Pin-like site-specific DNA recombinase
MFDGYVRVSKRRDREGPSFQSPDEQWARIQKYARDNHVEVRRQPNEIDVSGSKLARPVLDSIVERIRCGESEGIIVAKVDRLSRAKTGDAFQLVEKIKDMGGRVGFAELDIDTVSPQGEFALTMWLAMARLQWRGYQDSWGTSVRNAIDRGVFVGPTPIGYDRNPDRTLTPNADADKVRRAFEIAEAEGVYACRDFLREALPYGPPRKYAGSEEPEVRRRPWTVKKAEELLQNRIYIGEMRSGEDVSRWPELALVDRFLWDLAQPPPRATARVLPTGNLYPLAAIAECGTCGRKLVGGAVNGRRRYRCIAHKEDCSARAIVTAQTLETIVLAAVRANPPVANYDEMLQRSARVLVASDELDQMRGKRDAYKELGELGVWRDRVTELEAELEAARVASDRQHWAEIPDLSDDMSLKDMRSVFERAVARCVLAPGRGNVESRVTLELRK